MNGRTRGEHIRRVHDRTYASVGAPVWASALVVLVDGVDVGIEVVRATPRLAAVGFEVGRDVGASVLCEGLRRGRK